MTMISSISVNPRVPLHRLVARRTTARTQGLVKREHCGVTGIGKEVFAIVFVAFVQHG
jgi:hypothetical protein